MSLPDLSPNIIRKIKQKVHRKKEPLNELSLPFVGKKKKVVMNGMVKWCIRDIKKQIKAEKLKIEKMGELEIFLDDEEFKSEYENRIEEIMGGKAKKKQLKGFTSRRSMPDLHQMKRTKEIEDELGITNVLNRINKLMVVPDKFEQVTLSRDDPNYVKSFKSFSKALYDKTIGNFHSYQYTNYKMNREFSKVKKLYKKIDKL
ncbi:unnamed protein product [Moneuplotes crassus]|uniref:Uncharacterized protein n=1 Tax=Euplotes crassus TaxID=5936 RepID=A0AAD1XPE7_EUPCR|nr:unnamed protein product [Moneuplotes crassus]